MRLPPGNVPSTIPPVGALVMVSRHGDRSVSHDVRCLCRRIFVHVHTDPTVGHGSRAGLRLLTVCGP